MRQPLVAVLAIVTVVAIMLAGIAIFRQNDSHDSYYSDEYSSFHRDPTRVVTDFNTKASKELDEMWESTGWLGHEIHHGGETFHAYVETAWAVAKDDKYTYLVTCYHGIKAVGTNDLVIGYWFNNKWNFVRAIVVGQLGYTEGDAALMRVTNSELLRSITPMKLAKKQTFSVGDEVLIGGVQPSGGPAFVCLGTINMVHMARPEFVTKGWAWYGFSGGPIRLRKTGEVIGYVRAATADHKQDASESICGDFNLIRKLVTRYGLANLIGD